MRKLPIKRRIAPRTSVPRGGDADLAPGRASSRGEDAVLIGLGNPMRGDDGAGLEVARRVRALAPRGLEVRDCPLGRGLIESLAPRRGPVILVDAMRAAGGGIAPGTTRLFTGAALPRGAFASTHGFGAAQALSLVRALGSGAKVSIYGIQGADFSHGEGLSPEVETAVQRLSESLIKRCACGKSGGFFRRRGGPCTNTR